MMLFKQLYNWIKYKTLPPSFLFKNRLFIERDSKHRRVMSNYGLSFRNSKWSNYEVYNIKPQFRNAYLRYLFWIIAIIFVIFAFMYYKNYYIALYAYHQLSFWSFVGRDMFGAYVSYVIWILSIMFSIISHLLYSYFFFNFFGTSNDTNQNKTNLSFLPAQTKSNFDNKNLYVSKNDLNWFTYSWLTNPNSFKNTNLLENIFETNISTKWWRSNSELVRNLYKSSFFVNLSSEKQNTYSSNSFLMNIENSNKKFLNTQFLPFSNNNNFLDKFSPFIITKILTNSAINLPDFNFLNLNITEKRYDWNLNSVNTNVNTYPYLVKNKVGFFFMDNFNYQSFSNLFFNFEELWTIQYSIKNQTNSAKWNRWLYRYSILHRKLLKNSHKLTLSKKLLNSGFFDSSLINKNIWASENLSRFSSNEVLPSLFNNYYGNFFNENVNAKNSLSHTLNFTNNGSQKNSLELLNFYETSYFWFLKRFYLFNTLSTNHIKSKLINTPEINPITDYDKNTLLMSYLLKANVLNQSILSHSNNYQITMKDLYAINENLKNYETFNFELKDIYLSNFENDLFNKDNLSILYWLTTRESKNNNILFYNYLKEKNECIYSGETVFNSNNCNTQTLKNLLAVSLINIDYFYLNDLEYLSLFL